jgi:hypothetical protein
MKTQATWKDAESRALQRKTLAAVNRRIESAKERPATAKRLREVLEHTVEPTTLAYLCECAGTYLRNADADTLFDMSYGLAWARQFPCYQQAAKLKEYFATQWGEVSTETQEDMFA